MFMSFADSLAEKNSSYIYNVETLAQTQTYDMLKIECTQRFNAKLRLGLESIRFLCNDEKNNIDIENGSEGVPNSTINNDFDSTESSETSHQSFTMVRQLLDAGLLLAWTSIWFFNEKWGCFTI